MISDLKNKGKITKLGEILLAISNISAKITGFSPYTCLNSGTNIWPQRSPGVSKVKRPDVNKEVLHLSALINISLRSFESSTVYV